MLGCGAGFQYSLMLLASNNECISLKTSITLKSLAVFYLVRGSRLACSLAYVLKIASRQLAVLHRQSQP